MKLKCLTCTALTRLVYLSAAQSPHVVDVELLELGLHNQPADLRTLLQEKIDAAQDQGYDAITLAYGLCGQATLGLQARDVPVIIPRAHDCVTLFLGSRERYKDQFENKPGTYWYSQDYIERNTGSGTAVVLGANSMTNIQDTYDEYVEKYGQDNADYLMEVMGAWQNHYQRAAYIDLGIGDGAAVEAKARAEAERRGWAFERLAGNMILIRDLLRGDWRDDYLRLEPGQELVMTYNDDIIGGKNVGGS